MKDIFSDSNYLESCNPVKKEFLLEIMSGSKNITDQKMLMPYFKQVLLQCRQKDITFTNEEITSLISLMKNNATEEENARIDKIIAFQQRRES